MRSRFLVLGALMLAAVTACSSATVDADPPNADPPSSTSRTTISVRTTVTAPPTTITEQPSTVTVTPTEPTLVPPPPTTEEPAPKTRDCPYLSTAAVRDANGQNVGRVATIAVDPHPICLFYRPDGTGMAVVRIVQAASDAEAAAAVNQWVPIADSFEVDQPTGWTGGAMTLPAGTADYPDMRSIYAVSKGPIAVIALSNQQQSIKGRQMAIAVIADLGL